ncbi:MULTISPECIES: hypothetical protein [Sorangium]|uniref:hypothetical protein n=1 Tax=Sorangium TaxID=39643 RepID=UPI003D9C3A6E
MRSLNLSRTRGARRAAGAGPARRSAPLGRLAATILVAAVATIGPILEGTMGDGRGWTIGLLLLLATPSLVRAGGPRFHPLDPETYIPATYFLSVGYSPILRLLSSREFALPSHEALAMQVGYAGAVGCAIACTALSRPREEPDAERLVPSRSPRAMHEQDWATIGVGLLGLGLVVAWIATIGVGRFFTMNYASNHLEEDGKGLLTSGWYLVGIAIVYLVLRVASLRKAGLAMPKGISFAAACFFVSILLNTVMGRRGPLVWTLLSVALALHAYGIKIRRLWMGVGIVGILFYGIAVEGARAKQGSGFEAQISSAAAHLDRVENPLEIGELKRIYANLVIVVNEEPPIITYPGESWVNAFLILVPKPLWSDRPLGLAQRYAQWAAPDFARHGGGFAMGAAAEGYLNVGLAGTAVEIGVFSALFFMLPLLAAGSRDASLLVRAAAANLASFAYNQFRGELAALLKITLSLAIAALAVHLLTSLIQHIRGGLLGRHPMRKKAGPRLRGAGIGHPSVPRR